MKLLCATAIMQGTLLAESENVLVKRSFLIVDLPLRKWTLLSQNLAHTRITLNPVAGSKMSNAVFSLGFLSHKFFMVEVC